MNLPLTNQTVIAVSAFLVVLGLHEGDVRVEHLVNDGLEHGLHVGDKGGVAQEAFVGSGVLFLGLAKNT